MFKRRLYFLIPDADHARQIVDELARAGVDADHVHVVARTDIDLTGLPAATNRQQHDTVWRLERALWGTNLALFAVAAIGLVVALVRASLLATVAAAAVMLASFVAGALFALRVPKAHLDECRDAIRHGEVLLMIDVPRARVAETEALVGRRHPEATPGGVGWTLDAFGI